MILFGQDIIIQVAISLLGFSGFLVARHIYKHKHSEEAPLVCPVRFDCATVVHSDYSKFMGIPVEFLGMVYYAFVCLSYLAFLFLPYAMPNALIGVMAFASVTGFLFSIYLIAVQIFILKKGCSWCFVSAFICILIFSITLLAYNFSYVTSLFLG
ncbi:MAG: hypothetical protein UU24_C0023G0011 [Candidatus Nomurabacteria bacterium GW2011_GWA2_40_9]|uniref:Vitamin K epoxide reductase domain-containing protein n=1 Tax=Candidatus Nomurabacteria bacterium GW2011_GWA2_40_9 TaxID=1618734 RepID=A0A0G0TPB7_9BACT|nr:MAG: hypothetical protein UU24_C0023G0011 [Candidatus Nomurabacteria bacterium GW2011_GWA2_40_9]